MELRLSAKRLLFVFFMTLLFSSDGLAQTKRALLIGINTYLPPGRNVRSEFAQRGLTDLEGPVNDVTAMREILTKRFGFDQVDVLTNEQATRDAIMNAIRQRLVRPAARGDVSVLYYAGHGSQVRNSASDESDRLDESIVPADAYAGARDIRDKELRVLFNEAVDKGIILTAIFDSCNSGSIARGPAERGRAVSPDMRDVKDPLSAAKPETKGALIISAAQDYQVAKEIDFEGVPRGVFTLALQNILNSAFSTGESAQRIFSRTRALMQSDGRSQEPVLAGTPERVTKTLFGLDPATQSSKVVIPVGVVRSDGRIELQGGIALGFAKDTELQKLTASGQPTARIKVTELLGLNRAFASIVNGDIANIKPGDPFEIVEWFRPQSAILKVWVPTVPMTQTELERLAVDIGQLRGDNSVRWLEDLEKTTPTHFVSWESASWKLFAPGGKSTTLGTTVSAKTIRDALISETKDAPQLFVHLPIAAEFVKALNIGRGSANDAIEIVSSPELANYFLVGRPGQNEIEYAWVLNRVFQDNASNPSRSVVLSTTASLPTQTKWVSAGPKKDTAALARSLEDYAQRLGMIRSWLQIEAPENDRYFPYRLAIKDTRTGSTLTGGDLREGNSYSLALRAENLVPGRFAQSRFIYVFAIDSNGERTLVYPQGTGGSVENKFPRPEDAGAPPPEIPLSESSFTISPPFGTDTFVMLASEEQIPDLSVFSSAGVRAGQANPTPLSRLLVNVGSTSRRINPTLPAPTNWSIDRVVVRSVPLK